MGCPQWPIAGKLIGNLRGHYSVAIWVIWFIDYEKYISKPRYLFYDDIVHEFGTITPNKGHYAVQGHSRSPILVSSCSHTRAPVTKQCNLAPVAAQQCPATGKVTVGLASHWSCVTDLNCLFTYWLKA